MCKGIGECRAITLTADIDNFTGSTANDTFIADETTTAKVSLADVLTGGAGTDSLTIYNTKGVAPQMSGIESLTLNTVAAGVDFNASSATGLTSVTVKSVAAANDSASVFTVGSGVAVTLENSVLSAGASTDDNTGDIVVAYDAAATSASLTLNKVTSGVAAAELQVTGAALTTLNIATTGAASTIAEIVLPAKVDSLVVTGDQNLTITDAVALATNATTKANAITSTGLTGDLSLSVAALAANQNLTFAAGNGANTVTFADVNVDASITATFGSGKDTVTLTDATGSVSIDTGAGNDKVTISKLGSKYNSTDKETASINLGAGDDTLVIANAPTAANLASGVTLAGGDGTDTLNIDNDEYLTLFDNATADVTVSGFEKLALQNGDSGTFDLSKVSGGTMTTVVLGEGVNTGGALVVSNAAAGLTVDWALKDANTTAVGAIDLSLKDASGSADAVNLNVTLTSANSAFDNLTIADLEIKKDSNNKAVETLNISVDGALSGTSTDTLKVSDQYLQITSLDLSGGVTTVNISGDGSTKINGYANASTLVTVDATNSSGNNNISVAAGTTFIGGSGNDTFTGTQAQFAAITSLTGGTGTDTVAITDTAATTATLTIDDKAFKNVAAAEAISFTGANAGDFNWVLGGYANTFATNNSGVITATATALAAAAAGDDITVDASGLSGTNAINLTLKDTAASTDAIGITITGSAGADTLKIEEAKAASAAVISVDGGAGNDTITVTVTATHAGTVTIAGGAGDDTITGSAIDDTITGGSGADKITGGEGADSITGGTGADQIILTETAAAADTVVIAAGDSNVDARDVITGFAAIAVAVGTADVLDLVGAATIQANGTTDGSDYNTIMSHSVTSGVITFDDANTYAAALTVNSSNLSDVLNYLAANITGAGATVAFAYDSNSDGTNDATLVFQNNAAGDILVELVGVTGITAVAGAAGANTVMVG